MYNSIIDEELDIIQDDVELTEEQQEKQNYVEDFYSLETENAYTTDEICLKHLIGTY